MLMTPFQTGMFFILGIWPGQATDYANQVGMRGQTSHRLWLPRCAIKLCIGVPSIWSGTCGQRLHSVHLRFDDPNSKSNSSCNSSDLDKVSRCIKWQFNFACCETEASDFSKLFIERIATFGEHLHKHSCVLDTVHFCWRKKKSHAHSLPGDRSFDHETCSALPLYLLQVSTLHTKAGTLHSNTSRRWEGEWQAWPTLSSRWLKWRSKTMHGQKSSWGKKYSHSHSSSPQLWELVSGMQDGCLLKAWLMMSVLPNVWRLECRAQSSTSNLGSKALSIPCATTLGWSGDQRSLWAQET